MYWWILIIVVVIIIVGIVVLLFVTPPQPPPPDSNATCVVNAEITTGGRYYIQNNNIQGGVYYWSYNATQVTLSPVQSSRTSILYNANGTISLCAPGSNLCNDSEGISLDQSGNLIYTDQFASATRWVFSGGAILDSGRRFALDVNSVSGTLVLISRPYSTTNLVQCGWLVTPYTTP